MSQTPGAGLAFKEHAVSVSQDRGDTRDLALSDGLFEQSVDRVSHGHVRFPTSEFPFGFPAESLSD